MEKRHTLQPCANGFIILSYDYELLFKHCFQYAVEIYWDSAGARRPEEKTLDTIQGDIAKRGWENRFVITGKISDEKRDAMLSERTYLLCLFKYKVHPKVWQRQSARVH